MNGAVTPSTSGLLPAGTVVDYHGSIAYEHGAKVVIGLDAAGYILRDLDYPDAQFELRRVRRASITPTGVVLTLTERVDAEATPAEWGAALVGGAVRPAAGQVPAAPLSA